MVNKIWQFSPPTDFGLAYREELKSATNIRVLLHASATEIVLDQYARTVEGVRVRTLDGKIGFVAARVVVLACGGIENARMLLLSNGVETNGIGNGHDLVGHYFADHPHQVAGHVEFAPGAGREWVSAYKERHNHGARYRPGIGLTAEAQQDEQILNDAVHLCDWQITDTWQCTQSKGYHAVKALAHLAVQTTAWAHLKNDIKAGRIPHGLGPIMYDLLTHPYGAAVGVLTRIRHERF